MIRKIKKILKAPNNRFIVKTANTERFDLLGLFIFVRLLFQFVINGPSKLTQPSFISDENTSWHNKILYQLEHFS